LAVPCLRRVQLDNTEQSTEADLSSLLAQEVDNDGNDKAKCEETEYDTLGARNKGDKQSHKTGGGAVMGRVG